MVMIARIVTTKKGLLTSKNVISCEWTGAATYKYILKKTKKHYIILVTALHERDPALTINLQEWRLTTELPPYFKLSR